MKAFAVLVDVNWAPTVWNDCAGFVTTRIVPAATPDKAGKIPIGRLIEEIRTKLTNAPVPKFETTEIWDVEFDELKSTPMGWVYYPPDD